MTNVYTRKNHHPRTTTLSDYRVSDYKYALQRRLLSPTRLGNPHPHGLNHQSIPSTKSYLIWHPDLQKKERMYPQMVHHTKFVNFSCNHPDKYDYIKTKEKLPDIRYTENTVSRMSYINPSRYDNLAPDYDTRKVSYNPDKKAVTGIVPNLFIPAYPPVIDK